jgi:hypothetical protein
MASKRNYSPLLVGQTIGGVAAGSLGSMVVNSNSIGPQENMSIPGNLEVGQTVKIDGDLKINGHIQADEITIDVRKIILNMDYGYIEETISKVSDHQLDQLLSHLNDLKLMIEKEKFRRT